MRHQLLALFLLLSGASIAQNNFSSRLSTAALELTKQQVNYSPGYCVIPYPNGDVAPDKGVCTEWLSALIAN
jgi:uncharacterized protein YijF (DUF1287 family)